MGKISPYEQVANELRSLVLSGRYGTEGALPSVAELSGLYSVSSNTINRALSQLAGEGILQKKEKKYIVSTSKFNMGGYVDPFYERAQAVGQTPFTEDLEPIEVITLPNVIAESLGVPVGKQVTHRLRLLGLIEDGVRKPSSMAEYFYLISIPEELRARMAADPKLPVLVEIAPKNLQCSTKIFARLATAGEARHFHCGASDPVLHVQSVIRTMEGDTLLFQEVILHGTSYNNDEVFTNESKQIDEHKQGGTSK